MAATFLVTGANGFVGRSLCSRLRAHGYKVRTAVRDASSLERAESETFDIGDIGERPVWAEAVAGVHAVIHLAARVHVVNETSSKPLYEFRRINVAGTKFLAECAARQGVKRFVYVSSIKVNGEATAGKPFTHLDTPQPQDAYGISKWEAEQSLWEVASGTSLEVTVVRPPLVYGPGVRGNFRRLLSVIARGFPLPLASIRNSRSLLYNGNLTSALIACATHPAASGRTYLLSDGEDISTPDLLHRVGHVLGKPARLLHCPPSLLHIVGNITGRRESIRRLTTSLEVDSSLVRKELGWSAPHSVSEGLEQTGRWFVEELHRV